MSLDFPTVAVLGYLLCLGIALGFSLLLLVLRGQPALRLWTASLWLLALSLTSVALRAQLPVVPLVIFGNAVLALSAVAMLYGVARHLQRRLPSWQPALLAGAYVAGIVVFVVPFPNLAVRLNVASLFAVLINSWMAWVLVRHAPPEQRTSCWLAAAIFGAEANIRVSCRPLATGAALLLLAACQATPDTPAEGAQRQYGTLTFWPCAKRASSATSSWSISVARVNPIR